MRNVLLIAGMIATGALSGCGESEKSSRGVVVLEDLDHTPAHKSQTARAITTTDREGNQVGIPVHVPTALAAPEHSIARGERVIALPAEAKDAAGVINPLLPTAEVLLAGRHTYKTQCGVCHGADGISAHAPMAKYLAGVPQLNVVGLGAMSDGEVFHIVSNGKARMPAMASRMTVDERWAMIHYLRVLARTNAALVEADSFADQVRATGYSSTTSAQSLIDQRERDADIIHHGGGERFLPGKKRDPAQVPAGWNDLKPAGGNAPAKAH